MRGTIDLHCHLLPGLDDGAADLEDAIEMAALAEHDGIEAICATPHIRFDHVVEIGELRGRVNRLAEAVRSAGCSVRVLSGGEVAVSALDRLDDRSLKAVSLGDGGRWILLEPGPGPLDDRLEHALDRLHDRGFRALIAHPERHGSGDLLPRLDRLIASGALVQATAAFFTEEATRSGMLALAEAGAIHVLGSDAHSSRAGRPVSLSPAFEVLARAPSIATHLEWIAHTAPRAIVAGADLTPPYPVVPR